MYKQHEGAEPIAIVGSSCRFAGGATSPSKFWDLLSNPSDLSREVPGERFHAQAFYHPDGEYHGTTNSTHGYWLDQDHRVFDAGFFNITPREAEAIDPQQRLLLEVVYEAMEAAGYTLGGLSGADVGVFAGVMTADYDTLSQRDELTTSQYYATGNARSIMANRVSYFLNVRGPSMTIDTACSSSLVALHQAVLSLRAGETTRACVAGVNLMLAPEQFIVESSLHMLSPTGRCRMWDADADGYARGEGVAALFLKPLAAALADGDPVEAVIRETGVNSDGRTPGITMPNAEAQTALIAATYRRAGLDPRDPRDRCQYFEAHGTGTKVGDPVEAAAIHEAFFGGQDVDVDVDVAEARGCSTAAGKLLVGSVKTVVGHTEGAAGLAGLLKVVQAIKHGRVPPNLHLTRLNPTVQPFYQHHLHVPTTSVPWPEPAEGCPRRASVNCFGFGGTNAHAIVESYGGRHGRAPPNRRRRDAQPPPCLPLLVSAASPKSLRAVIRQWRDYLECHPDVELDELAWNLVARRTALPYRLALSAASRAQALAAMVSAADGMARCDDVSHRAHPARPGPRVLAVFTGQGAQWPAMSSALLRAHPVYRQTIRALDAVLSTCPDPPAWTLERQLLAAPEVSRVHEAAISQPLCTALQIGLCDVLRACQLRFHTVVGHSSGEIAAAYAAGRLTARDAILVAYYRGLYAHLAGGVDGERGGMLAAGLSESEAVDFCRHPNFHGRLCVAAANAPSSVTLSGDRDVIHRARDMLIEQNKFARMLLVDTAYHSPHMARSAAAYVRALRRCAIDPKPVGNQTKWVSSVYGIAQTGEKDVGAGYWRDNMVQTVRFQDAIETAIEGFGPFDCAVEIGPHPALKGPVGQTAKALLGSPIPYACVLERSVDDQRALSDFLGFMWTNYGPASVDVCRHIELTATLWPSTPQMLDLPSYPWDHSQIHYRESRLSRKYHLKTDAPHELLGVRTRDDNDFELRWRNVLKPDTVPWMQHHTFQGEYLLPASAYCVMVLDATKAFLAGRSASVVEINAMDILNGIGIESGSSGTEVLFSLRVNTPPRDWKTASVLEADFLLSSCPSNGTRSMRKNMTGSVRAYLGEADVEALPRRQPSLSETLTENPETFYRMMDQTGLVYTGPFRAIQSIRRRANFSSTTLQRRHAQDTTSLLVSPATLDSCFQSAFLSYASPGDGSLWTSFLPTRIERIRFNLATCTASPSSVSDTSLSVDTKLVNMSPASTASKATFTADIGIFDSDGQTEIQIEGLSVTAIAHTRAEDDYELYLHTVVDVDPTDEIVRPPHDRQSMVDPMLMESLNRVVTFFHLPYHPGSFRLRGHDTTESIDQFIQVSPYKSCLSAVRDLGQACPTAIPSVLPSIVEAAHHENCVNKHAVRIVQQIAHRFPRMNVLSLVDAESFTHEVIREGLKMSFSSLTIGVSSQSNEGVVEKNAPKVHHRFIDLNEDIGPQLDADKSLDLVVVSASILDAQSPAVALRNIRASMTDGGFLVLVRSTFGNIKGQCHHFGGSGLGKPGPAPLLEWPDILESCGYTAEARYSDQHHTSGFAIHVRRAVSSTSLYHWPKENIEILIVGGTEESNLCISRDVQSQSILAGYSVVARPTLEEVSSVDMSSCTTVVMLSDLDQPLVANMTDTWLQKLRELLRPGMKALWVVQGARADNPHHSATFGFARTLVAEVPSLRLQILDLEYLQDAARPISRYTSRLVEESLSPVSSLHTVEPELHVYDGRCLIPRVVPLKAFNDRLNSSRRVISSPLNTLQTCVEVVPTGEAELGSLAFEAQACGFEVAHNAPPGHYLLQVLFSSQVLLPLDSPFYVCLGVNVASGVSMVAFSTTNASYVTVPSSATSTVPSTVTNELEFIRLLVRFISALALRESASTQPVVLVGPDEAFRECVIEAFKGVEVTSCLVALGHENQVGCGSQVIHVRATDAQIKAVYPSGGATLCNLLPTGHELSKRLANLAPRNSTYLSQHTASGWKLASSASVGNIWHMAVGMTERRILSTRGMPTLSEEECCSLPRFLAGRRAPTCFEILDWEAEREVHQVVKSTTGHVSFEADKTYVLFGMTSDLGQSLSRLLIEHGARHIVLASRNADTSPRWCEEVATTHGAKVQVVRLDITKRADVFAFARKLTESMPPVAGVVNGANVLEDSVFAQMTADRFQRVLGPKVRGSQNLDDAFAEVRLDFFIMTSSFAAIGGHPGQSNYAAANMYMNGLAANRRRRGLAGSVLNIGVIYGLGLLHRDKNELYAGLEREGYPPVSERDLHHMFLEAVAAGRPGQPGQPVDITTGLRRFRRAGPNPLHWHSDPRFGHFALDDDEGGGGPAAAARPADQNLLDQLEDLTEPAVAAEAIMVPFLQRLEALLQLPRADIDRHRGIAELGIDSLIAVEIRNWFWHALGQDVAVLKILAAESLDRLCFAVAEHVVSERLSASMESSRLLETPATSAPPSEAGHAGTEEVLGGIATEPAPLD